MAEARPSRLSSPEFRRARARISYFMLFRLAMLAAFTVMAGSLFYARDELYDPVYVGFVWSTLAVGYGLTIVWARWLPRVKDLSMFASLQTASDILLSTVVVQMTGGVESGFVTLYLIAVLGAATMGGPAHTWAVAGSCTLIYLAVATLQLLGVVTPFTLDTFVPLDPVEHWRIVGRTLAGLVGVSVLSSYLNAQLTRSVSQVGKLRALNEHIVQSLSSGLLTLDLEGRIIYFNPTARTLLELEDEQIGSSIDAVFPGLGPLDDGGRQELAVHTPGGRLVRIGLSHSALRDAEGARIGSIINFQDVTPIHELTQRARRNERLAALGGLAASVAHEIRNPLAAISGSAELLGTATLQPEDRKLLEIIHRESNRLSDLISDLLAYTRPKPPQPARIMIGQVIREACDAFRHDPATHGLELRTRVIDDVEVELDPSQLSQVLWNLLRNAAEAIDGSGRIEVRVRTDGRQAVVEIEDSGRGIPPTVIDSVFDPFFTTKESGTGFGLAVVHRTVGDNGGTISVESQVDRGTTFTIRLPRFEETPRPADSGVLDL